MVRSSFIVHLSSFGHVEPSVWVRRNCPTNVNSASASFVPVKSKRGHTLCPKTFHFLDQVKLVIPLVRHCTLRSAVPFRHTLLQCILCCFAVLSQLICALIDCSTMRSCRLLLVCMHPLLLDLLTETQFRCRGLLSGSVYQLDSCLSYDRRSLLGCSRISRIRILFIRSPIKLKLGFETVCSSPTASTLTSNGNENVSGSFSSR